MVSNAASDVVDDVRAAGESDVGSDVEVEDRAELRSDARSDVALVVRAAARSDVTSDTELDVAAAAGSDVELDVKAAADSSMGVDGEAELESGTVDVATATDSVGIMDTGSAEEVGAAASTAGLVDTASGGPSVVDYSPISMHIRLPFPVSNRLTGSATLLAIIAVVFSSSVEEEVGGEELKPSESVVEVLLASVFWSSSAEVSFLFINPISALAFSSRSAPSVTPSETPSPPARTSPLAILRFKPVIL